MANYEVNERVQQVAERVIRDRGDELVELDVRRIQGAHQVRLFVDRPGGISLDELQQVSVEVGALLDMEDPFPGPYTLEVSSPGLDRPLRTEADFRRNVGRLVRIEPHEPLEGRRRIVARLVDVSNDLLSLRLEKEKGRELAVPLSAVAKARLEIEFR